MSPVLFGAKPLELTSSWRELLNHLLEMLDLDPNLTELFFDVFHTFLTTGWLRSTNVRADRSEGHSLTERVDLMYN